MYWLLIPAVLGVGKLIYDAVSDDDNSSAIKEAEEKAVKQQDEKNKETRRNNLSKLLWTNTSNSLEPISTKYLNNKIMFKTSLIATLDYFSRQNFQNADEAIRALNMLSSTKVELTEDNKEKDALSKQLMEINTLEQLLKEL